MRLILSPLLSWSLLFSLFVSAINVSNALKCYFCYGSDESGDCSLPEDEHGNRLVESSATMKIISCLPADENCYKMRYLFNGKTVTGRGCGNDTFCDKRGGGRQRLQRGEEFTDDINGCDLCSRNMCNGSAGLGWCQSGVIIGVLLSVIMFGIWR